MIADFEDFCVWTYVLVDDIWSRIACLFRRPGPAPACSDSELITLILVGECCGWDVETNLISHWQQHPTLFPVLPERSRFNRRRRNLLYAINEVRRVLLGLLDWAADRQCAIDSLPVPVMRFHLVPSSSATSRWKADGAAFGKVPSKKQTIFGYKLHLVVTLNGVIRDFVLAPANEPDLAVGAGLLAEQADLLVLGDKGYISQAVAAALAAERGVTLLTVPRANQRAQASAAWAALHAHWRQIIETVNQQLSDQFHLEENHAHTFWGLCARLYSKLAAHTLCIYLNRLLGQPACLQIKGLAFPN
jgi:transposase